MDHIIACMILGLLLIAWVTRAALAQNSTVSSQKLCLPGNINNNNLTLTGSSGTLQSPKQGSSYPPDLLCNWLITVPEGNIVKLTFRWFDLEWSSGCTRDYVQVFDGNNSSSESKGKFCGYTMNLEHPVHPDHIRSSGQYMLVQFRSNWFYIEYRRGFKAMFTSENEKACPNRLVVTASASDVKTLTSLNYPFKPENNLNCNWILEVDSGLSPGRYIVKVTFNDLEVECDDSLKFYDGNSTASSLLGSYCGSSHRDHPEVIYSTGRYLYVNFRTDGILTYKGFSLRFSAVKEEEASGICRPSGGNEKIYTLSGSSGTIFSPDYPVPYPDDAKCVWTVSVPVGNVVKLTFEIFRLELDPKECKVSSIGDTDYVQIRDGPTLKSKDLAFYCGYYNLMGPSDAYSTGNYMTIIFQSILDGKQRRSGFRASFEAVDPQFVTSNKLCFPGNVKNNDLQLSGLRGTLWSPLRASVYPPDLTCDWLITVPEGKIVKLHFDTLDLQSDGSQCTKDYVEIRDGNDTYSDTLGRFCAHLPEDIHSSGRYMRVRFRSDSETSLYFYNGFNASFVAEEKPTEHVSFSKEVCFPGNTNNNNLKLTGLRGTLQSPHKDDMYPSDLSCDWLITVPDGKIVKLSFERFDLEPGSGNICTADYVEVLDGNELNSVSKGTFCGWTIPDDILSSGRYMRVIFRSDSSLSHYGGFRATFTAEDKSSSSSAIVIIVVIMVVLIALALFVVCFLKRKKKPNRDAAVEIPMLTAATSTSHGPRPGEVQRSRHTTRPEGVQRSPHTRRPDEVQRSPHRDTTRPREVQRSPRSSRPSPLPPVGYAPVPVNREVPPPPYPYPLESPPPYPGEDAAPQYPPPGQSYPWQQSNSSAPVERSAPTEGLVEPSAPPESP